jgi:Spy/CpxP family protein refolding chaperone
MDAGPPRAFVQHLFPPPLVMQNQEKIGLDEGQRAAIRGAMQETQAKLLDLRWRLDAESEKLGALLAVERPDEAAVMAQVAHVLAVEAEVKKAHLRLLVGIKRVLTSEQQKQLVALRRARKEGPPAEAP